MDVAGVFDRVQSHALELGLFETVNTHEPKAAPGQGLRCAIWVQAIGPLPLESGLAATTSRVEFSVRIYQNMLSEPMDAIDPAMLTAVDTLIGAYSGDFTLGGAVREVDCLGAAGAPLSAQAGYINQDGKLFRVMTITLPVVVNDAWTQEAT